MPIDVAWMNDNHDIILRTYEGRWTADELSAAEAAINAMIDSVSHRVDVITDIRSSNTFPPNVSGLFESYHTHRHPRIQLIVSVGKEINYDVMALLAEKHPDFLHRYAFAASVEEAERIIADDRAGRRSQSNWSSSGKLQ